MGQKERIEALYKRLGEWFRAQESYDIFAKRKINKFLATRGFTRVDEIATELGSLNACVNLIVSY